MRTQCPHRLIAKSPLRRSELAVTALLGLENQALPRVTNRLIVKGSEKNYLLGCGQGKEALESTHIDADMTVGRSPPEKNGIFIEAIVGIYVRDQPMLGRNQLPINQVG